MHSRKSLANSESMASSPIAEDSQPNLSEVQSTSDTKDPPADWWSDRFSILLLVLLYTAQGLPMGLAFGSIPLLLKESGASYAALAQFSMSSLPYSVKLFIAPVVDALFIPSFGRRKSWIVPVQLVIGCTLIFLSSHIPGWVREANVSYLTPTFLVLLAMTATQDIAVDGWSLTMLQKKNVAYASTCQSLGLTIGYFATFTIFLALNSPEFCDKYIRPFMPISSGTGAVTDLAGALQNAGLFYLLLTMYITFFKKEGLEEERAKKDDDWETLKGSDGTRLEESMDGELRVDDGRNSQFGSSWSQAMSSIKSTYSDLFVVTKLPAVRTLVFALLIAKVGFSAYDNVTDLKLLEHGFAKETMASMAVFQSPFILLGTIVMGKWTAKWPPLQLYLIGFLLRFIISLTGPLCVALLSRFGGTVTPAFYLLVLSLSIVYTLASECIMFIGMGAFFLNITSSSVHVAGSYLTLLNTSSNMGGIWPKAITLWLVSKLTIREQCAVSTECPIRYDGYYIISIALLPLASAVGLHLYRTMPKLQQLPDSAWRVSKSQ